MFCEGKTFPGERMLAVAEHYYHFGGKSPINEQNRQLIAAIEQEFAAQKINLSIYWGNRNWHPLLHATLRQMKNDGVRTRSPSSLRRSVPIRAAANIVRTLPPHKLK